MLSVLSKFVQLVSLLVYEPRKSGPIGHAKYYTMKVEKERKKKKNLSDFLRLLNMLCICRMGSDTL